MILTNMMINLSLQNIIFVLEIKLFMTYYKIKLYNLLTNLIKIDS